MTDGSFVRAARELAKDLIDFLDEVGSDPDFEGELLDDDSDELEEDDPTEDDGSAEPSLGSLERHPTLYMSGRDHVGEQTHWAAGNCTDLEEGHDGSEPDVDDEPSLGWTTTGELGDLSDKEAGDEYEGRVVDLDRCRAAYSARRRRGCERGPHDAA